MRQITTIFDGYVIRIVPNGAKIVGDQGNIFTVTDHDAVVRGAALHMTQSAYERLKASPIAEIQPDKDTEIPKLPAPNKKDKAS